MSTKPTWKLVANLGDVHPVDYGGYFVYVETTGVYPPVAELVEPSSDDDEDGPLTVYRFTLDRCTFIGGILSDNKFHPAHPAWFASPESRMAERPQDTSYLSRLATTMGCSIEDIAELLCSDDPIDLAQGYRMIGEYHGFDNLDSYPLTLTRDEAIARYGEYSA